MKLNEMEQVLTLLPMFIKIASIASIAEMNTKQAEHITSSILTYTKQNEFNLYEL